MNGAHDSDKARQLAATIAVMCAKMRARTGCTLALCSAAKRQRCALWLSSVNMQPACQPGLSYRIDFELLSSVNMQPA
eukprot:1161378-Pelagomonas_calceolata.AAC.13